MKLKIELALVALSAMIVTSGATTASAISETGETGESCRQKNSNIVLMSAAADGATGISDSGAGGCVSATARRGKGKGGAGSYASGKRAYSGVLGTSGEQPEAVGGALLSVSCKGRGEGMICTGGGLAPLKREVAVVTDVGDGADEYTGKDPVDGGRPDKGSSPVPEPTAALLFGAGLVVAGAATRRNAG